MKIAFLAYLIALISVLFPVSAEENIVQKLEVSEPRAFAYYIGDTLTRTVYLQLRKPYKLKTELLPKRKRMGRWIVVISSKYKEKVLSDSTQYEIELQYQIINIIPELKEVILPRHYLVYENDSLRRDDKEKNTLSRLEVSPYKIGVSSIVSTSSRDIQPDIKPALLAQSKEKIILYGSLFLASLAGLALLLWGIPFTKKEQPFGEALVSLKKLKTQNWDNDQYGVALKIIHKAFNTTAGKIVFSNKLDDFLQENKQFLSLKSEIERFFTDSEKYFFEVSNTKNIKLSDLIGFVQSCQKVEEGR